MVSALLQQSLAAHERAKALRKSKQKDEARTVLIEARSLRLDALAEDPDRTDPAWDQERVPHNDMMTFYAAMLDA